MAKRKPARRTKRAPKKAARRRSAPDWAPRFLARLAQGDSITRAAAACKVGRTTVYERRDGDEAFAAQLADALEQSADRLEDEARRRAHDGLVRARFHQGLPIMVPLLRRGRPVLDANGQQVMVPYVEHEYSDTLLIFLLKAQRPQKYRERFEVDHTGGLEVTFTNDFYSRPEKAPDPAQPDAAPAGGAAAPGAVQGAGVR